MKIPQWLTLLLNERERFEIAGGKRIGCTDYIYYFSPSSFPLWLNLTKKQQANIEITLVIAWEDETLILDARNKGTGARVQDDEISLDLEDITPGLLCQHLDQMLGLVQKKWGASGYTGDINIEDAFVWLPKDPNVVERITVTGFRGEDDDREIQCTGSCGKFWLPEDCFREVCVKDSGES